MCDVPLSCPVQYGGLLDISQQRPGSDAWGHARVFEACCCSGTCVQSVFTWVYERSWLITRLKIVAEWWANTSATRRRASWRRRNRQSTGLRRSSRRPETGAGPSRHRPDPGATAPVNTGGTDTIIFTTNSNMQVQTLARKMDLL